jgi:cytochrome c553
MKRAVLLVTAVVALGAKGADNPPAGTLDLAKGKQIAESVCAGCHGVDGNSADPVNPKIAGQHQEYLLKQMQNFKAPEGSPERRVNAVMNGMVAAVAAEDLPSVAAYYANQPLKPETAKSRETIDIGQKLWRSGDSARGIPACAGCHGPAGAGLPAQFPRLSGQYSAYTETQLKAFRLGERANDSNKMMRMIAVKLTDAEIRAVADYAAGLR